MAIGIILKEFVEKKIPNKKDYKKYLGMGYEGMYKYFKDERKPGYELLKKLVELGFDINTIFPVDNDTYVFKESKVKYSAEKDSKSK